MPSLLKHAPILLRIASAREERVAILILRQVAHALVHQLQVVQGERGQAVCFIKMLRFGGNFLGGGGFSGVSRVLLVGWANWYT